MRRITKGQIPEVLRANEAKWLAEYKAEPSNSTRRTRYRDKDIKTALLTETSYKCVYCESKLGHNTPGDVEHKIPSSKVVDRHFDWENLTIACNECNRRKSDFHDDDFPFVDPYVDNVESMFIHCGPVVRWRSGNARAEFAVKRLELLDPKRTPLMCRKVEKIGEVLTLMERVKDAKNATMKALLTKQLQEMADASAEYSAMVKTILEQNHANDG